MNFAVCPLRPVLSCPAGSNILKAVEPLDRGTCQVEAGYQDLTLKVMNPTGSCLALSAPWSVAL